MTARPASPTDAPALAELLTRFNTEFATWVPSMAELERRFAAMLLGQNAFAIIADEEAPVGFALLTLRPSPYYDGPIATLDELYVEPRRRGQGLGTEMLTLALRLVRERCCGEVQINVDEGDVDARRFYERHGFSNHEPDGAERMLCYLQELR